MPEIKIKHVVSFSSEDRVHKAENLIKPETYRKWTCAVPGERSANVILQFEKATFIHSIDIGNENSAFVEILVGRSSNFIDNFQVLLVASSFMSPLESRNRTHVNRVRMFGPEKLSEGTKNQMWDCVQIVCTQPFNETEKYGLTFIKFHSPPGWEVEQPKSSEAGKATVKLGAFKIRYEDDDDDDSLPSVGSSFRMKKTEGSGNSNSSISKDAPSYATAVLSSEDNLAKISPQNNTPKRKTGGSDNGSQEPPAKKPSTSTLNEDHIVYKAVAGSKPEIKKVADSSGDSKRSATNSKLLESKRMPAKNTSYLNKPNTNTKKANVKQKVPFEKLMEKVVIVLSGFVNPLRGDLRDKALEMGAKYKADWDSSCSHLICAFTNTPKYVQVNKLNGKIVSKDWIIDCYKKKQLLPWQKYTLDTSDDSSEESEAQLTEESEAEFTEESEDSEEEYAVGNRKKTALSLKKKTKATTPAKKKNILAAPKTDSIRVKKGDSSTLSKSNLLSRILNPSKDDSDSSPSLVTPKGSKDESETEDEEALQDYKADTDVDSESGGDTEDEINRVEKEAEKKNAGSPSKEMNGTPMDHELSEKPDIAGVPLPELPNIFKRKRFLLYGKFNSSEQHDLQRYITAYNGVLEDYISDKIKYVITENKWDKNFEDALSENEDLIFVKPAWIYKCHDSGKLVPYQPYIIIPDS